MEALMLARRFWVDGSVGVRMAAWTQLGVVLALQVLRARASTVLSAMARNQMNVLVKALRIIAASAGKEEKVEKGGLGLPASVMAGWDVTCAVAKHALAVVCLYPVGKLYSRALRNLQQQWISHLTRQLLESFVLTDKLGAGVRAKPLSSSSKGVTELVEAEMAENPDQRIADDCEKFVQVFLSLTLEVFEAVIHLYFFVSLLRGISPKLSRDVIISSLVGTAATLFVGRNLSQLFKEEREANGEYRYFLTRCREHAESISFMGGGKRELALLEEKHDKVLSSIWSRRQTQDFVDYFCSTYQKIASLMPVLILVDQMVDSESSDGHGHSHDHDHDHDHDHHGESSFSVSHGHSHVSSNFVEEKKPDLQLGTFTQAVEAYEEVLFHLSIVSERFHDFARLKTYASELQSILNATPSTTIFASDIPEQTSQKLEIVMLQNPNEDWLRFEHLTITTPPPQRPRKLSVSQNIKVLIRDLTIRAPRSGGLLVSGNSGVGKTTLLRAVAGIWQSGSGKIARIEDIFFIPQSPYMTIGTLKDQLIYPRTSESTLDDSQFINALSAVGLGHLSSKLDQECSWSEELSVGEQQRIGFARMLLSKKKYIILDEATSACDMENESKMYDLVESCAVAWISVGHRPTIERYHCEKLLLEPNGIWHLFTRASTPNPSPGSSTTSTNNNNNNVNKSWQEEDSSHDQDLLLLQQQLQLQLQQPEDLLLPLPLPSPDPE